MSLPISSPTPSVSSLPSSSKPDVWRNQARNPVSLRLYKVLGTKYDDEATKEALKTLSDFYSSPPVSTTTKPTSGDAADEWDESDSEDDEALVRQDDATQGHLAFLRDRPAGDVASKARRHMRRDVERRLAEGSHKFLEAFGDVDQKLDMLQAQIGEMKLRCGEAEGQLEETNEACKELLERAGNLRQQSTEVAAKQSIVSVFLARFTLTDEENEAITSRDVPIGSRFFGAMDKTVRIREDCRVLMAGEDGPTQAGLDIMALTSTLLEQGYDKMTRWCSNEFRQMGRDTQLEVSPSLRETVRRLRERPELLSEAMLVLAQIRSSALSRAFLDALTRGGPGGFPRPIELHAHDPLRYVGDMLAWVHQALAGERELSEALLREPNEMRRMVGATRKFGDSLEEGLMRELVDGAVGRLCSPLKVRVQQTVRSQESSIMAYKIANLLQFYMMTMRRTLGEEAVLSATLKELTDIAYRVFFDSIEAHGRSLLRVTLDSNDSEVTPPAVILDHMHVLREILAVHASTLADEGAEDVEEQKAAFARVLDAAIDPAIEMATTAADQKRRARSAWDAPVFVLNCLSYMKGTLAEHEFAHEKTAAIDTIVQARITELIEEHFINLLHDAGLAEVMAVVQGRHDEPLSHIAPTEPPALQAALASFSSWLSSPAVLSSTRLGALSGHGLPDRVHRAALGRIVRAYTEICAAVKDPKNRYEAATTLLGGERPFGQISLLRQIFGMAEVEDEDEVA